MTSPTEKFRKRLDKSQKKIAARLDSRKGTELMEALTKLKELEEWSLWQFPAGGADNGVIGEETLKMSRSPGR